MILVVSYEGEEHSAEVIQRLRQQGREVVLLDLAHFPAHAGLALRWPNNGGPSYLVDGTNQAVDLGKARVGWWRRVRPFSIDSSIVSPTARAFAESETAQAMSGMLDELPCDWVNPRAADDTAHHKPYQWAIADDLGLSLPRTLVTNKPEEAREFIDKVGLGKTAFKAFLATQEAW